MRPDVSLRLFWRRGDIWPGLTTIDALADRQILLDPVWIEVEFRQMNTKHASDLDGDNIIKRRDEALRRASNTPPKSHGKPTNAKKENAPARSARRHRAHPIGR